MSFLKGLFGGGGANILDTVFKGIDALTTTTEEKEKLKQDAIKMYMQDRSSAREMYMKDSGLQKVFAVTFLLGYLFLSGVLVYMLVQGVALNETANTLITMLWTGMTTKVNTIVDFLFGGSQSEQKLKVK